MERDEATMVRSSRSSSTSAGPRTGAGLAAAPVDPVGTFTGTGAACPGESLGIMMLSKATSAMLSSSASAPGGESSGRATASRSSKSTSSESPPGSSSMRTWAAQRRMNSSGVMGLWT